MTATRSSRPVRLAPRDPRGGRPPLEVAARLGDHILDIALQQFMAHGPEGASMDRIAAAANVSKRTLYARYGSKNGLLVAAVEQGTARHLKPVSSNIPRGTPRDKLLHVARKMLDLSLRKEIISIAILTEWIAEKKLGSDCAKPVIGTNAGIKIILPILQEAATTSGDESCDDLVFLAGFIFDALVGGPRNRILVQRNLANSPQEKREYLERTMDLIVRAVPFLDPTVS